MHAVLSVVECPSSSSHEFKELFRLYMCAVYSALTSCIVNCITEENQLERFAHTYLFKLNRNAKNASVWESIVPLHKKFMFPLLYDEVMYQLLK